MENSDIRWEQRFSNFKKTFAQLERFTAEKGLNEMEEQGLIKAFEYTFELSWKTLQDLLKDKGYSDVLGPKPVIEQAFQDGYILDGNSWMQMHKSRNLTSHTYNEETAEEIIEKIRNQYFALFQKLKIRLEEERSGNKIRSLMNEISKYGLSEFDLKNIISVLQKNSKIKRAILFGSRAKGNFHPGSDIDIALDGEDLKLDDILNLSLELENLTLAYKFDLIIFKRIREEKLMEHIGRVGITLFHQL